MAHRLEYQDMMTHTAAAVARNLTLAQAEERFAANSVPFARQRELAELPDDPQVQHNQMFQTTQHPVAGELKETRPAARFSRTPAAPAGFAPTVGQHTEEILREIGMGDKIVDLRARNVIDTDPKG